MNPGSTKVLAENDVITKQELYVRILDLNSLPNWESSVRSVRSGSGGKPSNGTPTFPLAQHMDGGSNGHFLALQCTHSTDIEPMAAPAKLPSGLYWKAGKFGSCVEGISSIAAWLTSSSFVTWPPSSGVGTGRLSGGSELLWSGVNCLGACSVCGSALVFADVEERSLMKGEGKDATFAAFGVAPLEVEVKLSKEGGCKDIVELTVSKEDAWC